MILLAFYCSLDPGGARACKLTSRPVDSYSFKTNPVSLIEKIVSRASSGLKPVAILRRLESSSEVLYFKSSSAILAPATRAKFQQRLYLL
jgi:hypothetical protein